MSDYKGIVLYRNPGKEDNIPKPEDANVLKEMSSQMAEGVFVNREADGVKRLHAYKRFQLSDKGAPYLFMRVGIPQRKALAYARQAQTFMLVFLLIAVVGIMAMAWFLGNATIVRRLQKLVDVSHSLGHGDLKTRTGVEYRKDELGELTMTFDEMAENLEIEHAGREEAKEHIKKVAEEWQTTFDSITDLIMILDNEYNIVRVNRATVSFLICPPTRFWASSALSSCVEWINLSTHVLLKQ